MSDDSNQVKKAYTVPEVFRLQGRIPGQVPTKKRMRTLGQVQALSKMGARNSEGVANLNVGHLAGKPVRIPRQGSVDPGDLSAMPGGVTEERLLAQDMPMLKPSSISSNLGLSAGDAQVWAQFLGKAVRNSINEVVFRKDVMTKLLESGLGSVVRKAIFSRAMTHWRTVQKSLETIMVEDVDGNLRKALFIGPRGGRWADPQHKIPFDPKKHSKKGQKIFVIDKTKTQSKPKGTPENKQRQAEAKRQDSRKKIFVIDKIAEEKPEGGTSDAQAIQKVLTAEEKAETSLTAKTPEKSKTPESQMDLFTIPAGKVDSSLWKVRPKFGVAGGPDKVTLTQAGLDRAAKVATGLTPKAVEVLEGLPVTGEPVLIEQRVGPTVRLTPFGRMLDPRSRGLLKEKGLMELAFDPNRQERAYSLTLKGKEALQSIQVEQANLLARVKSSMAGTLEQEAGWERMPEVGPTPEKFVMDPKGIAESLNVAEVGAISDKQTWQGKLDVLPDGTVMRSGQRIFTKVSVAGEPFWRYTTKRGVDKGYLSSGQAWLEAGTEAAQEVVAGFERMPEAEPTEREKAKQFAAQAAKNAEALGDLGLQPSDKALQEAAKTTPEVVAGLAKTFDLGQTEAAIKVLSEKTVMVRDGRAAQSGEKAQKTPEMLQKIAQSMLSLGAKGIVTSQPMGEGVVLYHLTPLGEKLKWQLEYMKRRRFVMRKFGKDALGKEQEPGWERMPGAKTTPEKFDFVEPSSEAPEKETRRERKGGGEGARRVVAVEQGEHVWGSRKDKYEIRNPNDLDGLTPDEQAKVTTKSRLFATHEVDDLLESGMEPTAIILRRALESCVGAKPSANSLEARKLYIEGIDFVARSLDACQTFTDVEIFVNEWQQIAMGMKPVGVVSEDKAQWEEVRDQLFIEKGLHVSVPWQERLRLDEIRDVAWEVYKNAAKGTEEWSVAYREYNAAYAAASSAAASWHVSRNEIFARILGKDLTIKIVSTSRTADGKIQVWGLDESLENRFDNKYAMMALALGKRMNNFISRGKRPKVWRDAKRVARSLKDQPVALQEACLHEYLKTKKRRQRGKRERFHWEREVPGEVIRKGGKPIPSPDPKKFAEEFGFSNIQFGGWVSEDDAKAHLSGAHGGLLDLADILGVDPKTISLNGRLSIGIGARGGGRFAAHYECGKRIINITKIAGGGSLAHEWGHAFDHILSQVHDPESTKASQFMTGNSMKGVPEEAQVAIRDVMQTIRTSDFYDDAKALSPGVNGYYARPHEMFARAFESFIEDSLSEVDRQSSYLVSGTQKPYFTGKIVDKGKLGERQAQIYPQGSVREKINAAMAKLVEVMRETGTIQKALAILAERFALEPKPEPRFIVEEDRLQKAGPYIGPRGGKWADAAHTIPWQENQAGEIAQTKDHSRNETVVEYTAQEMIKRGVSPAVAAKRTAKKLSGNKNMFIDPTHPTLIDPKKLEGAIWDRIVETVVQSLGRMKSGKELIALRSAEGTFHQQKNKKFISTLKAKVEAKTGKVIQIEEEQAGAVKSMQVFTVEDRLQKAKCKKVEKSMRYVIDLVKAGPYIGPRGGKWADPEHTISWREFKRMGKAKFRSEMDKRRAEGSMVSGPKTFQYKEIIKAAGGIWDSWEKQWLMPTQEIKQKLDAYMARGGRTTAQPIKPTKSAKKEESPVKSEPRKGYGKSWKWSARNRPVTYCSECERYLDDGDLVRYLYDGEGRKEIEHVKCVGRKAGILADEQAAHEQAAKNPPTAADIKGFVEAMQEAGEETNQLHAALGLSGLVYDGKLTISGKKAIAELTQTDVCILTDACRELVIREPTRKITAKQEWDRQEAERKEKLERKQQRDLANGKLEIARGQGYGGQPYWVGGVIKCGDVGLVTVVSASKTYVRDDGMSFGVGDEEGYIYYAKVRRATEAESKKYLEDRAVVEKTVAVEAKRKAAVEAKYSAAIASIPDNYIRSMSVSTHEITDIKEIAQNRESPCERRLQSGRIGGDVVYVEHANSYDDWRTYLIAPPAVMNRLIDARIKELGITTKEAKEWLEQYSGCVGEEVYRRMLEVSEKPKLTKTRQGSQKEASSYGPDK